MSIGLNGGRDDVLPLLSVCSYSYLRKIIDLVIYSDIARVISLRIIIIIIVLFTWQLVVVS